jgi:Ca-activated chloride channel homolog
MKTLIREQVVNYTFRKVIVLMLAILSFSCANAGIVITGKVVAEDGYPLPGVTVSIKGTSQGTVTDLNGKYSIEVPDRSSKLVFSYVGYLSEEVKIGSGNTINIKLTANISQLNEVVVVGYGSMAEDEQTAPPSRCNKASISSPASYVNTTYLDPSTESYSSINENGFRNSKANPLSTFSIDVDRASYTNIKRFLNEGQKPPVDAVRVEEMINYFEYDYPQPTGDHPISITTEYSDCPWQKDYKLLNIGLQGKKIANENLPASNIVFLIDVSGSMAEQNKLPLLKSAFKLLVNNLREKDRVAIVVYAGAAGLVLPSTRGDEKSTILNALDQLQAGGSTAGADGIQLAYEVASKNFIEEGNNRVILATDGDFNVGVSNDNELEHMIVEKRKSGIFLTCLGVGMGNYKDAKLETLADKGNGNFAYLNDIQEANKVFVTEFGGTLFTIAKDVKIQVEFNPAKVKAYRLVGYENRMLNEEDFKDDTKDAGELGAGHTVTAIYEIIPVGVKSHFNKDVDELKYQKTTESTVNDVSNEIATVKFRYKNPNGDKSIEMVHPVLDTREDISQTSNNFKFSAAVAMFGMLLRNSEYKGNGTLQEVITLATESRGLDKDGYRAEFIRLVKTADNGAFDLSENNN